MHMFRILRLKWFGIILIAMRVLGLQAISSHAGVLRTDKCAEAVQSLTGY